jgi:site-specific DNA recombinase
MKPPAVKKVRCAIYTRVSTDHGLDQEFNSLDAQYDASSSYIKSQAHAGWTLIRSRYDDGGYSGGSTDRPDLQRLVDYIRARKLDVIVVYKVDRLTRSLSTLPSWSNCLTLMAYRSSQLPSSSTPRPRWAG